MKNLHLAALALILPVLAMADDDAAALRRSVSVSGQGEVSAAPDRARLSMAVEALNPELKAAQDEVNKVVRAFVAEAKTLGVKDEDLSTAGITVQPEYVWDEKARNNRLTGYRARRGIELTVRNLDQIGDFILRATRVGVNNVQAPVLESTREKELSRQALVKAIEDARAKAELAAQTLNVRLGPIHSLNASENNVRPPYPMMRMQSKAMAAEAFDSGNQEMGFAAGEIKFNATVNADFDLNP
jgi:uncharacterized protein YggE